MLTFFQHVFYSDSGCDSGSTLNLVVIIVLFKSLYYPFAWVSRSKSRTFFPLDARMAPMDVTEAVLPTPHLWLATAMIFDFIDVLLLMYIPSFKGSAKLAIIIDIAKQTFCGLVICFCWID